jgi:hypothetical protein
LDSDPIHQSFQAETIPVSPEPQQPLYASYRSRDENPRHRPSTDAAVGEISKSQQFFAGIFSIARLNKFQMYIKQHLN